MRLTSAPCREREEVSSSSGSSRSMTGRPEGRGWDSAVGTVSEEGAGDGGDGAAQPAGSSRLPAASMAISYRFMMILLLDATGLFISNLPLAAVSGKTEAVLKFTPARNLWLRLPLKTRVGGGGPALSAKI